MATILFQGKPINTNGELPALGEIAPDFSLVNGRLKNVSLADFSGKRKVLSIVPSFDTPTCAASTRMFNQKANAYTDTIVLVVSADLPFAQGRFCESEGLKNVVALSTFRGNFAEDYGVQIVDTILEGLTARAVIVLDEKNKVVYTELVAEVAEEPDYDGVLEVLRNLG